MTAKKPTAREIWDTLSSENVNEFTEQKNGLTYLSWSHAYRIAMGHYPDMEVTFLGSVDGPKVHRDVTYYEGGTAMVHSSVKIAGMSREAFLPVMDYRNKSIAEPTSRDISDAKQRCLVKTLALWGLGLYLYSGEDLPYEAKSEAKPKAKPTKATGEALAASLKALSGLVAACETHGGVEAKVLAAASSVLDAGGPLGRVQKAITHLEGEIDRG